MKSEKALKAGVGYTIGNYLIKGMNFLTIPIFARLLSTEDYGIYNLFVAYEGFLSIFIGLAIHSSYKNARYKYKDSVNADKGFSFDSYVSATFVLVIFNTLIWLIGVNVFGRQLTSMLMLDGWCINLLVIYSASNAIILCFNSKTSLTYEYKSFLTVAFINAIMNLTLSIMLVTLFFKRSKYVGRIIGTVIPITVLAFFIVKKYLKKQKICYIKDYLRWGIGYSLPIVPHGISQIILSQFDRIMINSMVGLAQAGIYSFAYNILC